MFNIVLHRFEEIWSYWPIYNINSPFGVVAVGKDMLLLGTFWNFFLAGIINGSIELFSESLLSRFKRGASSSSSDKSDISVSSSIVMLCFLSFNLGGSFTILSS